MSDLIFCSCDNCQCDIGSLSVEEFRAVYGDGQSGSSVLCFACDKDSSATVPGDFWQWRVGDSFVIDGQEFWVNRNCLGELKLRTLSHAHERARARDCLSSSTYLNTNPKKRGDGQTEAPIKTVCLHEALTGDLFVLGLWTCEECGWQWQQPDEKCPDCESVKALGGGEYCYYHHALLTEQSEDGALGWTRE